MLRIDVRRQLGNFRLEARFSAETRSITALFGRSGSGKTSLINLLAGLDRPDEGRIAVGETVLFDSREGINVPPEQRRLGYVFQESRLFPHMSVRSNLTYGMRLVPPEQRHVDMDGVVDMLDIGPLLDRRPRTLSGGEKQRVAIGRALLASPRLLLMDEPLASLDAPRKNEILPFIERLRDHLAIPIVYVSHAMDEIVRLADTMVLLSEGRVAAVGPIGELTSRLDLYPLTGRYEAGAVLSTTVVAHDDHFHLTRLQVAGQPLWVPRVDLEPGSELRLRIRARDVALNTTPPDNTSILNVLKGTVRELGIEGFGAQVDVRLDVDGDDAAPLIARVTRKATHDLGLKPGHPVYALIKAIAIDRYSLGGQGRIARRRN